MNGRFEGNGFVVTGGTRGIGRSIVLSAAAEGANVVFCGREGSSHAAAEVVDAVAKLGGAKAWFVPADVSREDDVERLFDEASERLPRLDVVINNAGVSRDKLLVETTVEDWNFVLATNVRGPFLVCRRAVEEFLGGGEGGRIVNVSSIAAGGLVGGVAYAASKSALVALTRSIAKEYGSRGIACNAVLPGFVATEMMAGLDPEPRAGISFQGRVAAPEEIAAAVLFLASKDASFVTGDALYVADGARELPRFRSKP
jgi:3-oxoacyl-[acyl-carrier protein] reductase